MRTLAGFLLAVALLSPAAAQTTPAEPGQVARLVRQLDDEDAAKRDAAAEELRGIGPGARDARRATSKDDRLGAEARARAAALIPEIEAGQEHRRIWGDRHDAARDVTDELKRLNEGTEGWELHAIGNPALDRAIPKVMFVIADWVGA
ncbi:MAG: hypothetical protein HYZ27_00300, partial [Deltaproteobacteria bacterium]|nr:hypothetical protein [Deltaproteobacteria bacterium]